MVRIVPVGMDPVSVEVQINNFLMANPDWRLLQIISHPMPGMSWLAVFVRG